MCIREKKLRTLSNSFRFARALQIQINGYFARRRYNNLQFASRKRWWWTSFFLSNPVSWKLIARWKIVILKHRHRLKQLSSSVKVRMCRWYVRWSALVAKTNSMGKKQISADDSRGNTRDIFPCRQSDQCWLIERSLWLQSRCACLKSLLFCLQTPESNLRTSSPHAVQPVPPFT